MKKFMKSTCIISLSILLAFSNLTTVLASQHTGNNIMVKSGEYTFGVYESDNGASGVVRRYTNDNTRSIKGVDETKNLLYALGYSENIVEKFTVDELKEYASAPEIIVSVTYIRTDEKGNMTYVDEETALKEAEVVKEAEQNNINNLINGITPAYQEIDVEINDYMKVTYCVRVNGEVCDAYVIGEWLTMPAIRSYDSIGGCGQYMSYTPKTGECTVYYDKIETVNGQTTTTSVERAITNIQGANKDGWAGAAAIFQLPGNIVTSTHTVLYTDFSVIFKYDGKITEPDQSLNFNAIGTYRHSTVAVTGNPSVSISTSGVDAGIGISVDRFKDTMSVWLEINYTP